MKKGDKSSSSSSMGTGKPTAEKKGKKAFHRTTITMDFDPKTSRLRNQEEVDKYLAKYDFCLNPGIKVEFCLHGVDVSQASPNDGVYMHPQVLTLRLRLSITKFVCSVLPFYRVAPSQLSTVA